MGLNDMYSKNDPTEVPSYFLSNLVSAGADALGNLATTAGSAIADGASYIGDAVSNIPIVGDVIGGGINTLGNGLGQVVSGNFSGGLGSLYNGADQLLGGVLPGGQAFGSGYLGNLYGQADRALGGYLPNVGGVGATPAQMGGGFSPLGGGGGGGGGGSAPMSGWDKAAKVAQLAKTGYGIYNMTQAGGGGDNQAQYNRLVQPGAAATMSGGGGSGGSAVSNDPAMRNTPVGGGSVPTTTKATGKGGIGDTEAIANDLKKLSDGIKNSNNKTKEVLDNQLNIEAPGLAPGQLGFLNNQQIGSPATGNVPSVTFDSSTVPMPSMPSTQSSLNQLMTPAQGVPVITPAMIAEQNRDMKLMYDPMQQGLSAQESALDQQLSQTPAGTPRYNELLRARDYFRTQRSM
jgi:hypothetical protein